MEAAGLILVVVAVLTVIAVVYAHFAQRSARLDEAFARVARLLNGRAIPGGIFGQPSLRLRHSGALAGVDVRMVEGNERTQFTEFRIAWPDRQLRCTICPERIGSRIGKFLGMQDIQVGDAAFDPRYLITGNDENAIRQLLVEPVRRQLEALRQLAGSDDVYVNIQGGRLCIKKRPILRDPIQLESFVRACVAFFDLALQTNAEGIEFLGSATEGEAASLDRSAAICQICGEQTEVNVVLCRSCKTPHHKDCWEYYGSCSTYGCGEKRFHAEGPGR